MTTTRERLLARIPLSERRVDPAGIRTAVLEGGEGAPLVLLHGQGEFGAAWTRGFLRTLGEVLTHVDQHETERSGR